MSQLSAEKRAEYQAGAARRKVMAEESRQAHLARAQNVAVAAADLPYTAYGATKVVLFGSTAHPRRFHERSDVDLAAWGIGERAYVRAVADLNGLDSHIFVDLVRGEEAPPTLLERIKQEGLSL